jgi:hypothetical protein
MPLPDGGDEKTMDGSKPMYSDRRSYYAKEKDIDPTTLFVGGLDMYSLNPWDEDRLRDLFSKYWVVEDVKIIRPCVQPISPVRALTDGVELFSEQKVGFRVREVR